MMICGPRHVRRAMLDRRDRAPACAPGRAALFAFLFPERAKLGVRIGDREFHEFFDAGFSRGGPGHDPIGDIVAFVLADMALAGGHMRNGSSHGLQYVGLANIASHGCPPSVELSAL